jgi:hypothetical protein
MNRKIVRLALSAAVALALGSASGRAATIWTDWSPIGVVLDSGSGGSATGSLGSVSVSYSGQLIHGIFDNTSNIWLPATSFVDGVVVTTGPDSVGDNLDIDGSTPGGTITFSSPVVDPLFAIASLGSGAGLASFTFDQTPTFIVGGPTSTYGGGSISVLGNVVSGQEGNGVVQFIGTYSSISWTNTPENFYYFTVGVTDDATLAPEPASVTLLGFGLLGLVAFLKKKRS